jgi:hypothetical protein
VELISELTGLSTDAVVEQRQAGESFPKIAEDEGVDADAIVDELYAAEVERLDTLLEDGLITQGQYDWALENLRDQVESRVLSDGIRRHRGPGGPGGGPGARMGPGGPAGGQGDCWQSPPTDDVPADAPGA